MSKFVFISDAATIAATLTTGSLTLMSDGAEGATVATGAKRVAIATDGKTSMEFKKGSLQSVEIMPYNTGTAQETTVTLPDNTGIYRVRIWDTTLGTRLEPYKAFNGTAEEIKDEIDAAGADVNGYLFGYSCAVAGAVLTISAPVDKTFRVSADEGSTINYATAAEPSVGTPAKVAALESAGFTYDGRTNLRKFPVVEPASQVDGGGTYDILIATFNNPISDKTGNMAYVTEKIQVVVACKIDGTSVATDLKTELDKLA